MLHNSVLSFASEWYVPFSFGYALATCRLSVAWCVLELGGCFPDQCCYFLCDTTVNFDAPIVESPQFCERMKLILSTVFLTSRRLLCRTFLMLRNYLV
jgi:hypothetical protein